MHRFDSRLSIKNSGLSAVIYCQEGKFLKPVSIPIKLYKQSNNDHYELLRNHYSKCYTMIKKSAPKISSFSASRRFGKISSQSKVHSSSCPFYKMSVRQSVRRQTFRPAKCLSAKCLSAKCPGTTLYTL